MNSHKEESNGFTLIELMVVVVIIGILAAVVLATVDPTGVMKKGRDSQRKTDISEIARAINNYATSNKGQPPQGSFGPFAAGANQYTTDYSYNSTFLNILKTGKFLKIIPTEKQGELNNNAKPYYVYMANMKMGTSGATYEYDSTGYLVYGFLENRSDADCMKESNGTTVYTPTAFADRCMYLFQNGVLIKKWN